ncbi:MAG: ABC transporter ATP-binding protein [Clostridiales bacterium]|nr:ABC transporter ATP-binding protein [Clostridiales bacterium]
MIINPNADFMSPFRISSYIKENIRFYSVFCIAKLLQILLLAVIPYILSICVDQLTKDAQQLSPLLAVFFVCTFFELFVSVAVNELNVRLSNKIAFQIEYNTTRHIKRASYQSVNAYDDAYLAQRINNDAVILGDFVVEQLPYFLSDLAFALLITVITFTVSLPLGMLVAVFIVLLVLVYLVTKKIMYTRGQDMLEAQGQFFSMLSSQFLNILSIKMNAWYDETDSEFIKIVSSFFYKSIQYLRVVNTVAATNALLCRLAYGGAIFLLGSAISTEAVSIGAFSIVLLYIQLLLSKLQSATEFGHKLEQYRVAKNRMEEFCSFAIESNGKKILTEIHEIRAENLSVKRGTSSIFANVSLSLKKGRLYVIRGENGAGKTTFVHALLGVLERSDGRIFYNNELISDIDLYSARKQLLAVATQEPYIYSGTLEENITYGTGKPFTQSKEIPIIAELISFMEKRERKENTSITSKNTPLSGGEKQKISLSRALLKDADVLILDEPTNALDSESIDSLLSYLQEIKENHIIIIISHNERMIRLADEVIDLQKR